MHTRFYLGQDVADVEDAIDEDAVCGAFDFEVAEEGVGAEEGEDFVEGIVGGVGWFEVEI